MILHVEIDLTFGCGMRFVTSCMPLRAEEARAKERMYSRFTDDGGKLFLI